MRKLLLACTTSVIALSPMPALAQEAAAATDDAPPAAEITVTGSRLVKDGSQAPTPVTTVTSEALVQTAPSNIPDALNKLPVFSGSSNQSAGLTFAATASLKGNYLNLRNLGLPRVLTLFNGNRAAPTTFINAVDANMLPQLLVSRVDVVTGGTSAVYGSDAVSGVVNYILDEKFSGLKAVGQVGLSGRGDDLSYRYGAAFGTSLGDRIHVMGSYEHYKSEGIPSLNDRAWAHPGIAFAGAGTTASPITLVTDARTSVMTYGGLIASGPLAGQRFLPDGTLVPFVAGTVFNSTTQSGGDGVRYTTSIAAKLKTDQAFLRVKFDVSDSTEFYVQGMYGKSESSFDTQPQNHRPGSNRNITIFAENPFLRPSVAALMAPGTSFNMGRFFNDIPSMYSVTGTKYLSVQTGLKGEFGPSWKWDVNYVHGQSTTDFLASEFDARKFFAAVDAVDAGQFLTGTRNGQIVCRITLTNPTFLPGCVPMNVMGSGNISSAAYAYTRSASVTQTKNKMDYVNVNVHGDLFDLPAGPVAIAFGAEYRHQSLTRTSNGDPASVVSAADRAAYFGNIRAVPSSALKFLVANVGLIDGSQDVKEAYGEIQIPLLKDKPLAENLDLNLAARVTDYKTSGTVTTWKVGATWTPVPGLRFRASQSRDIAAPSLFDLYAGQDVRNLGVSDPLTGTNPVPQIVNQGNAALQPEISKTTAIGLVLQPRAIPGLTISVDAYRINISGAIQGTNQQTILNECHASNYTSPICSLIVRPGPNTDTSAANGVTKIFVQPFNLASLKTQGIDFEVGYTMPLAGGDLALRAFVNYLDKYDTQALASQPVISRAGRSLNGYGSGTGLAKWRALFTQSYTRDRLGVSVTERLTGSYTRGNTEVFAADYNVHAPNRTYVDVNLTYDVMPDKKAQLFFNVQNLFNVSPPIDQFGTAGDLNVPTDTSNYDVVGQYFTAGVRVKF